MYPRELGAQSGDSLGTCVPPISTGVTSHRHVESRVKNANRPRNPVTVEKNTIFTKRLGRQLVDCDIDDDRIT